ncbi:TPA: hypothetical protein DCZ36_03190 [Candidatus Gracilibacteria bacterium]|nr:hypothetical protein [Candidatus Gracilibacteria bacterium]
MTTGIAISYKKDGPISSLTFEGEINQTEIAENFSKAYRLIGTLKKITLLFDLSAVEYINSGFIGNISELYADIEENGGKMVIVGNPIINDTFDLVGFGEFVKIFDSKKEALDELKDFLGVKAFDFQFMD